MVFLIPYTQNRDVRAINLKLYELIRAMDKARNQMIDIQKLIDLGLDEMQAHTKRLRLLGQTVRSESPLGRQRISSDKKLLIFRLLRQFLAKDDFALLDGFAQNAIAR
jgi:hypothetical protein